MFQGVRPPLHSGRDQLIGVVVRYFFGGSEMLVRLWPVEAFYSCLHAITRLINILNLPDKCLFGEL